MALEKFLNNVNSFWLRWKVSIGALAILFMVALLIAHTMINSDVIWLQIILFTFGSYYLLITISSFFHIEHPKKKDLKPFVSIIVPAHNEEHTISESVQSICQMDYFKDGKKNFELVVVDDGSTDQTPRVLENLKQSLNFKLIRREPPLSGKGKGAALNAGLKVCRGECILVFDADAIVKPDFLSLMTKYFSDPEVVGVQAKVRMKNPSVNHLTSLQDDEFATFNRIIQKGRTVIDGATALGGNGQMVKRKTIESVGGWNEKSITEDLDLSVSVLLDQGTIKYCDQAIVYQEAVPHWKNFLKQRIRWAEGHLETMINSSWKVLKTPGIPLSRRIDFLFYLVGINIVFLILLSYVLGFIQFLIGGFKSSIPEILWIFASLVFFPTIITGLYFEVDKRPHIIIYRSLRFWLFCLHWIPVFFAALYRVITVRNKFWVKTTHKGSNLILKSPREIKSTLNSPMISSQKNKSIRNLLIVEDEIIFAQDLQITLEQMGYKVLGITTSAEDALKKIAIKKPDLVLMDIILQGNIDGIDATHEIWKRFKIPVVYITAHSDQRTLERLKASPYAGLLIKPINISSLTQILEKI
ncbi:MAG: glycosyltransferase [Methanobacteriaceae archaeon]|nr:glycosyltransferase [Methanobacteriaceae archaeon]